MDKKYNDFMLLEIRSCIRIQLLDGAVFRAADCLKTTNATDHEKYGQNELKYVHRHRTNRLICI